MGVALKFPSLRLRPKPDSGKKKGKAPVKKAAPSKRSKGQSVSGGGFAKSGSKSGAKGTAKGAAKSAGKGGTKGVTRNMKQA